MRNLQIRQGLIALLFDNYKIINPRPFQVLEKDSGVFLNIITLIIVILI